MKSSGRLVKEDPERAAVWQGRKVSSGRGRSEGSGGGFFKVIGHLVCLDSWGEDLCTRRVPG